MAYDKDIEKVDEGREERKRRISDSRSIKNDARDNARGKLKKRSRTSGAYGHWLKHKKPRGSSFVNPKTRIVNYMAAFGYSDEEFKTWLKTGKAK
jgi:hypothetical protein